MELDHENFRKQDTVLETQVTEVNKYIEQHNSHSQKFSMFLFRSGKKNRKHKNNPFTKYSLNYGLYVDGLHPHLDLAKLWLIRISLRLENDCLIYLYKNCK